MRTAEYKETLETVLKWKMNEVVANPVYEETKYAYGEYVNGLNEGYVAGLREALRTIEKSDFLIK